MLNSVLIMRILYIYNIIYYIEITMYNKTTQKYYVVYLIEQPDVNQILSHSTDDLHTGVSQKGVCH